MGEAKRTFRGPETWAMVRETYLGGATAREAGERFGIKEATLRKRAYLEGWTKRDHATASDPSRVGRRLRPSPPGAAANASGASDLGAVARRAAEQAGFALAQGRHADAAACVRTAEALVRLHHMMTDDGRPGRAAAANDNAGVTAADGLGTAMRSEPSIQDAVEQALRGAARALAEGRASDATALARAAELVQRVAGSPAGPAEPVFTPVPDLLDVLRAKLGVAEEPA